MARISLNQDKKLQSTILELSLKMAKNLILVLIETHHLSSLLEEDKSLKVINNIFILNKNY